MLLKEKKEGDRKCQKTKKTKNMTGTKCTPLALCHFKFQSTHVKLH